MDSSAEVTICVLETRWKLRAMGTTEGEDYDAEWNATHEAGVLKGLCQCLPVLYPH